MKNKFLIITIISVIVILLTTAFYGKENADTPYHKIEKIDSIANFFKTEGIYFAGQPSAELLEVLKEDGVNTIINLRSEAENTKQAKNNYDEKAFVDELGLNYVHIPIASIDDYNPETLEKIAAAIETSDGKILLHCASCGRVTYVWMAYLIKYCGFTANEAVAIGKQMKYKFYLEYLLDKEVEMKIKA